MRSRDGYSYSYLIGIGKFTAHVSVEFSWILKPLCSRKLYKKNYNAFKVVSFVSFIDSI